MTGPIQLSFKNPPPLVSPFLASLLLRVRFDAMTVFEEAPGIAEHFILHFFGIVYLVRCLLSP